MRMRGRALTLSLCCAAALATTAVAPPAEARPVSQGYYTEAGIGAALFVGPHRAHSELGPAFAMRAGRDLFSWLGVGLHMGTSSHEATVPAPPEGEYFQLYHAGAEARIGFRVGRIGAFVDGTVGGAMISSNILAKVAVLEPGERFALRLSAGAGLEYQLQNRHYALGLAGQWLMLPEFDNMSGVTTRAYLRYTY